MINDDFFKQILVFDNSCQYYLKISLFFRNEKIHIKLDYADKCFLKHFFLKLDACNIIAFAGEENVMIIMERQE